jgi:hypothetical protein
MRSGVFRVQRFVVKVTGMLADNEAAKFSRAK